MTETFWIEVLLGYIALLVTLRALFRRPNGCRYVPPPQAAPPPQQAQQQAPPPKSPRKYWQVVTYPEGQPAGWVRKDSDAWQRAYETPGLALRQAPGEEIIPGLQEPL